MKNKKSFRWIVPLIVMAISLIGVLTNFDIVQATFTDVHAAMVLMRFETEIMQKSTAGQYYEALYWKHNDELIKIAAKYPEHRVDFSNVTRMFIPEIEAFLDGNGDLVYITPELMENLETELNWFASTGSPALREDIQKELQRFPLDQFVGMTMNEAYEFVNSNWSPNSTVEKLLVPNMNGDWAYYQTHDIYFEYPSSYTLQISDTQQIIYLIPTTDVPEDWNPSIVRVNILNVSSTEKDKLNPLTWYPSKQVLWEKDIRNPDFSGVNIAVSNPNYPVSYIYAFQYNDTLQQAIRISVYVYQGSDLNISLEHPEIMDRDYQYIQHIIDSFRIQSQ